MVIHPVSIPSIICAASALVLSVRFLGKLPGHPIDEAICILTCPFKAEEQVKWQSAKGKWQSRIRMKPGGYNGMAYFEDARLSLPKSARAIVGGCAN
jgi:hypothetical protein